MIRLYCCTSRTSGKMYVGVTARTVKWRWAVHCSNARKRPKYKFHRAIAKYGVDDFEIIELGIYPNRKLAEDAEESVIAYFDLTSAGYNTSPRGRGGASNTGRVRSPETRAKISTSKKGKKIFMPEMDRSHHADRLRLLNKTRLTNYELSYGGMY